MFLTQIEALACLMVIIRILTFRRAGRTHSYFAGIVSYLLLVGCGAVLARILVGAHTSPDWGEVLIIVIVAAASWAVRGDVAKLINRRG